MEVVPKMDIIYDIFHRQEDRMSRVRAVKVVSKTPSKWVEFAFFEY